MNTSQHWQQTILMYIEQLHQKHAAQEQLIKRLERNMAQLANDMEELKKREPTRVEKIEYKFDQLKVETVEGTLHIGVLPGNGSIDGNGPIGMGGGNSVEGGPYDLQFSSQVQTALFEKAKQRMDHYLQYEMPAELYTMQEEYAVVLGEQYTNQMIRDLKAQTDGRILYYLNQMNLPQDEKLAEDEVVRRTTYDIQAALKQHFENKKREGRKQHEDESRE